jgi:hypothetical protein
MKKLLTLALLSLGLLNFTSCTVTTTYTYYPSWHYNCYWDYDWYGYYYEWCQWEYFSADGSVEVSKDIVADMADKETLALTKAGEFYADKFSLSVEKGTQLAKTIQDFNALADRSEADLATFAEKLYGVNTSELVSAVGAAQAGNNAELEKVIEKSAASFNTTSENMKDIVEYIHGKALSENGIQL